MERIYEMMQRAIKNIAAKYFDRSEREFQAEYYHQLRESLDRIKNRNIEVTMETGKNAINFRDRIFDNAWIRNWFFRNRANIITGDYYRRLPDLLIHEYNNKHNQLYAIEIKKETSPTAILTDLVKLIVYCNGRLKYKKGILILINPTRNIKEVPSIKELLKNYPEIEIWIAKPNLPIEIICSETLKNYN